MKFLDFEGLQCLVENILNEIKTKISIPSNAKVGQYLSVKTVDEEGNPTEWETTDAITITVDDVLNEDSENPVQNKVVTNAIKSLEDEFSQLPVVQVPYYATQESGVSGFYLKVDLEELEPLVLYANAEKVEGKTVQCYMAIRCDDGTEKAVITFGRSTIFYIQKRRDNNCLAYLIIPQSVQKTLFRNCYYHQPYK